MQILLEETYTVGASMEAVGEAVFQAAVDSCSPEVSLCQAAILEKASSALRSPGAVLKKEANNQINGGSSERLDKRTDPLWLGGISEAQDGEGGCWRDQRFLQVQLKELEKSMDSDSCQNSLRYTVSHTHSHTPTCLWILGCLALTASNAAGLMLFLKAHVHICKHKDAYTQSKGNYLFPHDQRLTELLFTCTCWRWNGDSAQGGSEEPFYGDFPHL